LRREERRVEVDKRRVGGKEWVMRGERGEERGVSGVESEDC
jgi:hypothetical protein